MLLALYILRYFTMRKMGMARYMVYFREKWSGKELGFFSILQWSVLVIFLLLTLVLFLIIKKLFTYFGGKILRERGEKEAFPLFFMLCFVLLRELFWLYPELLMHLSPGQSFMLFGERYSVRFPPAFPQESLFLWGDTFSMMPLSLNWRRILT